MSEIVKWTFLVFAIYRLSLMIAVDEGPFSIFLKTRAVLGAYVYSESGMAKTNIGRGISCVHCVSVWVSALIVSLFYINAVPELFMMILGVSGMVSFLFNIGDK